MQSIIGTLEGRENGFLCSLFYGKWPNIFILWYDEPKKPEDMAAFFRKHPFLFNFLCWVIYAQFVYIDLDGANHEIWTDDTEYAFDQCLGIIAEKFDHTN
ncbi:hypothetical protein GCM10023231_20250 [Olivibacter ginsenosidimutans]|uniref:CdiI C-terminal domain-containing protein n=1 Tax=Olivibacter ginsenosidimutans TaxID=1176537 RepID=A0ABP9B977_9SPHI